MFGVRAFVAASPRLLRLVASSSHPRRLFATAPHNPKFSWESGLTDNFSTKLAAKAAQGVFSKQLDALAADGFEHDPFNVHQVRGERGRVSCRCADTDAGRDAAAFQAYSAAGRQR
jgi:hypothetical protein